MNTTVLLAASTSNRSLQAHTGNSAWLGRVWGLEAGRWTQGPGACATTHAGLHAPACRRSGPGASPPCRSAGTLAGSIVMLPHTRQACGPHLHAASAEPTKHTVASTSTTKRMLASNVALKESRLVRHRERERPTPPDVGARVAAVCQGTKRACVQSMRLAGRGAPRPEQCPKGSQRERSSTRQLRRVTVAGGDARVPHLREVTPAGCQHSSSRAVWPSPVLRGARQGARAPHRAQGSQPQTGDGVCLGPGTCRGWHGREGGRGRPCKALCTCAIGGSERAGGRV